MNTSAVKRQSTVVPFLTDRFPVSDAPITPTEEDSTVVNFIASSTNLFSTASILQDTNIKQSEWTLGQDLKPLADCDCIQIRQVVEEIESDSEFHLLIKYINVPNKYNVLNSEGETLFDILETTDGITRRLFRRNQPFNLIFVNPAGQCVLELTGDPGIRGLNAFVALKRDAVQLGKVVQINPFFACCNFSPKYKVKDEDGTEVSKIVWTGGSLTSCLCANDFEVYSKNRKPQVVLANINRQPIPPPSGHYSQADMYKLSFRQNEIHEVDKALLIAATIMLDFQFFEAKDDRRGTKIMCLVLVVLMLVILIFCVIGLILFLNSG